ncbi:MAG: RsmE family RNA methyltransferase [Candidatus Dormibacteraceae bacterium]
MPYFYGRREGDRVTIEGEDARHLARSLRARPGELIEVVEPAGRLLGVRLESVSANLVSGVVESEAEHDPEPRRRVWLAVAMLPATALELVLSRCTEAGAAGFILVRAERSVARGGNPGRWARICREASMLSGRLVVPAVRGPVVPAAAVAMSFHPVLLDRSGTRSLEGADLGDRCTLFLGPEGGWSAGERALFGAPFTLGRRNLRADTAALVALALTAGDRAGAGGGGGAA